MPGMCMYKSAQNYLYATAGSFGKQADPGRAQESADPGYSGRTTSPSEECTIDGPYATACHCGSAAFTAKPGGMESGARSGPRMICGLGLVDFRVESAHHQVRIELHRPTF